MNSVMRGCVYLVLVLTGIACSFSAQAAYTFKTVHCPGAALTQFWGVNNSGQIVGQWFADAEESTPPVSFVYGLTTGVCTTLPSYSGEFTELDGRRNSR